MRPLFLRLQDVTSYRAPLELDLSQVPPGALVAVTGDNGAGKTSLMDCLGPVPLYRKFSTRPGPVKDWCTGRAACVDLTFEYGGDRYRSMLNIDTEHSKGAGKEEAFLYLNGAPLTPGRVTDYDLEVERRFPSRDIFLASAFGAQNREGNFLAMRTPAGGPDVARRKRLFAEMLGLGHLQTLNERAAKARAPLDAIAAELDRDAQRLAEDSATSAGLQDQVKTAHAAVSAAGQEATAAEDQYNFHRGQLEAAKALLDQLEGAVSSAQAEQARLDRQIDAARVELAGLDRQLQSCEQAMTDEAGVRARAAELVQAVADKANAAKEYATALAAVRALEQSRAGLVAAVERAKADVSRSSNAVESGSAAVSRLNELRPQLAPLSGLQQSRLDLLALVREEEVSVRMLTRDADADVSAADILLRGLETSISQAHKQAELLTRVPCKGGVVYVDGPGEIRNIDQVDCGSCGFLSEARSASTLLPQLRTEHQQATERRAAGEAKRAAVRERADALEANRLRLAELDSQHSALLSIQAEVGRLEAASTLAVAAAGALQEATTRLQAAEADLLALAPKEEAAATAMNEVVSSGRTAAGRVAALVGADTALRELEAAAARLPLLRSQRAATSSRMEEAAAIRGGIVVPPAPALQRAAVQTAGEAVAAAQAQLQAARSRLQAAQASEAHARGRLAQLGDLTIRAAAIAYRRERVARRRAGFVLLEQALGRDGIQALEIDAAGPEVSNLCNELLEACYGPRFTVGLRTIQEAKGARIQKEVFDITVHDGLRSRQGSAEGFSGGEQVMINEALRLALAIFNARRHGGQFETLYRDEADTGLSENLRSLFPLMLRRGMEVGGFRNLYFITHHREAWEQADCTIRVSGGRATLGY